MSMYPKLLVENNIKGNKSQPTYPTFKIKCNRNQRYFCVGQ